MAIEVKDYEKKSFFGKLFGKLLNYFKKILRKFKKDKQSSQMSTFYVDLNDDRVNLEDNNLENRESINNEFVSVQSDEVYDSEVNQLKELRNSNESYDIQMDAARRKGLEIMQRRRESLKKEGKSIPQSYNDKNSISDRDYSDAQIENLIKSYAEKIVFDINKRTKSKINYLEGELKNYQNTRSKLHSELKESHKKLQEFNSSLKDSKTSINQLQSKEELQEKDREKMQKTSPTKKLKSVNESQIIDRMRSTIARKEKAIKSNSKRISNIEEEIAILKPGVTVNDVELAITQEVYNSAKLAQNKDIIKKVERIIKSVDITVGESYSVLQKDQVVKVSNELRSEKNHKRQKFNFEQQKDLNELVHDEKEEKNIYRNKSVKGIEKPLTIKDVAMSIQDKMLVKPAEQEKPYEDQRAVGVISTVQVENVNQETNMKSCGQ